MGNLITIVHPAHGIIGDILTVILCIPVAALFLFTFLWPLYSAIRDYFGTAEQVPAMPEKSILGSLPLGAPRDGGNYVYTGHGWARLTEEEATQVRMNLKLADREPDADGWEWRGEEHRPHHSGTVMEITNDGPDDVEEEEEVERPDEMIFVS